MAGYFRLPIVAALLLAASASAFDFRSGDLLFQEEGASAFSHAISEATSSTDNFIHVGIAVVDSPGHVTVVEASPEEGVREVSLQDFLDSSPVADGRPLVVVKRLEAPFIPDSVVHSARSFIGLPYDWHFLPDNGQLYCSELVYESFIDSEGQPIFQAVPMNFRAPDGSMPEFWTLLFEKLGADIPEGIPGTNPNGISADPRLREVYRY